MTTAAESGEPSTNAQPPSWELEARALAEMQRTLARSRPRKLPVLAGSRVATTLERARERLAVGPTEDAPHAKAGEWFLDNYYLVRRVARQVAEELPRGFAQRLPRLASGPGEGTPRIHAVGRAIVWKSGVALDAGLLGRFVAAYQQVSSLTIAELWALPTVLRATVLDCLVGFLADLGVVERTSPSATVPELALDPTLGVEKAIRALRVLADIDWKAFFEETSRVEALLRTDPAGVYGRMEFATCDAYRKAVEDLASTTVASEEEVATKAVALAAASDARRGHVGYYLVDEGRAALERQLGYRAAGVERLRRAARRHPTLSYLGALCLSTVALSTLPAWYGMRGGAGLLVTVAILVLSLGPAMAVATALVQWGFATLLPPRSLPKLDFARGLPDDARTLVVVPTLLGSPDDIEAMTRRLELHYLANPDPNLSFALLTDELDSETDAVSHDLSDGAAEAIAALNRRHGRLGVGPFHLLHREARYNPSEGCFMGWERKRGKLEELNRLLRGQPLGSRMRHEGDRVGLEAIAFVITLDSDTELPMGSARRLVGILAHPLNRAVFDPATGRVVSGYTVIQPRVETSPGGPRRSRFVQAFAGDVGFDIYSHASSDLYQDLFGSGIYVGKGIYDVDAFSRSLEGCTPENALLSHDLFEGIHGRAGLASDVVLFENYPSHYSTYARRMDRWVRGDFQLVPWLFTRVRSSSGDRIENRLSLIDRWKIVDNLRRSLLAPQLLVLLISGWTWLPGAPLAWTLGALAVLFAPLLPTLPRGRVPLPMLARSVLASLLLAHEAAIVLDAMIRTLVRMTITHEHLLRWTSAEQTARNVNEQSRGFLWREMLAAPLLSLLSGVLVAGVRPGALAVSAPLLAAWFLSPELARWVSRAALDRSESLGEADILRLRRLTRRTWLFFETFVGPTDQWLPVDNHQESPQEQTAHRTSPTNIGMLLLSALSAYDLGYLGAGELLLRLRSTLESVGRLEHYRGHLLNWYETRNLEPMLPRYVSTVDSGNLAGALLALEQGCKQAASALVIRDEAWEGLVDALGLLEEVLDGARQGSADSLRSIVTQVKAALARRGASPGDALSTLTALSDETAPELDRELLILLDAGAYQHDSETLEALRTWVDRFHHQLHETRREVETLLPWLAMTGEPAAIALSPPGHLTLAEVPAACRALSVQLDDWARSHRAIGDFSPDLEASAGRLREALRSAQGSAEVLRRGLLDVAELAAIEARGMDFRLLFDRERRLFHIGYDVTSDVADAHHYDLLASEARIASYLAIVNHQVPEAHWYALGRPMTRVNGAPALLSWGGTMFEYLMPSLLMRSGKGTLLAESCERAVEEQIAYGKSRGTPWGVSESAYGRLDGQHTYQYRSFGVPGLGFRRHLAEDKVVAPYASILATALRPRAVVKNLGKLESMGALGTYGLYEAVDFDPAHTSGGRHFVVVRSYMAHHQGMLLVALDNYLRRDIMVDRFHADASVATGEMLLNERRPAAVPAEWPAAETFDTEDAVAATTLRGAPSWSSRGLDVGRPDAFVLSNGRLTTWVTDSGGGGSSWRGLAVTNYRPDPTCDAEGAYVYLRDEDSGQVWRASSSDGRTTYSVHQVEYHRRVHGISARVEVTVAAMDDVEVRQVTLHNETNRPRRVVVTSAAEPVLLPAGAAASHPAFSRLFIESDFIAELDALVFTRRQRSDREERASLVHRLVHEGPRVTFQGHETDRAGFFGRHGTVHMPKSLLGAQGRRRGAVGAVLDPVMSLRAAVELRPQGSVTLAFVTTVARSSREALDLARQYGSMHAVRWAFRDAEQEGLRRLERARLAPDLLPTVQRVLSALILSYPSLRAAPDVLAHRRAEKRRLWGRGISGDSPILLVWVYDAHAPLLAEAIATQRYFRACGVTIDLVLLDPHPSGYLTGGAASLRSVLTSHGAEEWLDRHGGIFVVPADQADEEEVQNLESSARAVLDTREGSLEAILARATELTPSLPRLEATLVEELPPPSRPERPRLQFDNGTGGFTEDGREYVTIVTPEAPTPAPWCNVLSNPDFGCLTSESSLGYTWSENAGANRLTPWRNDPVLDVPSEAIYLRDEETAAVWSPTPLPAGSGGTTVVRHGAGYTKYSTQSHGMEQELTVFVPPDAKVKIARLRLKNTLPRRRRITATYYAEWVLGETPDEQRRHVVSEFDGPNRCLLATCSWTEAFQGRVAFLASELRVHGFTSDRGEFLGRAGDYARPEALERWGLTDRTSSGADPCGALQVHLELSPGEEIETHFVLGQAEDSEGALRAAARFRSREAVDAAWVALNRFWDDLTGAVQVKTPDASMDIMLNRWLLYQTIAGRLFGRTGFYQSSGAFGFRDQLQDVLALLHAAPERTRAHLLLAAAHQFEEGDVLHWWHPPSGSGVRTRCSDDLVWLAYATAEYVAATGDVGVLSESIPFLAADPLGREEHDRYAKYRVSTSGSLLEHCRRALERGLTRGRHGLPLMGGGDWNDGMSQVGVEGRGESVWLGWFLYATMNRFTSLCDRVSKSDEAETWRGRAESLRGSLALSAWDGSWYLRAFHDDGSLLGSAKSRECRIDSIAQSWAVLSGAADPDKAKLAMHAVDERLVREADRLVLLLWPPFSNTVHDPGYIRAYPKGVRENGGQYTHAATWVGWAHAALGDGDRAESIFRLLNPILRTRTRTETERYRVEPYVLAADVYSSAPFTGRGGWTWYTGAAGWAYRFGVEAILGLRLEDGQLVVNPCIPEGWKAFEASVKWHSQEVHVIVENPDAVSSGVASATLDGEPFDSAHVPLDESGTGTREVRVRLGLKLDAG